MLNFLSKEQMRHSFKTASAHGLHVYAVSSKAAYAVISKEIFDEVAALSRNSIAGLISSCGQLARILGMQVYLHLPYDVFIGVHPRDIEAGLAYYEADVVTKMLVRAKLNNPES